MLRVRIGASIPFLALTVGVEVLDATTSAERFMFTLPTTTASRSAGLLLLVAAATSVGCSQVDAPDRSKSTTRTMAADQDDASPGSPLSFHGGRLANNLPMPNSSGTAATFSTAGFVDLDNEVHTPQ